MILRVASVRRRLMVAGVLTGMTLGPSFQLGSWANSALAASDEQRAAARALATQGSKAFKSERYEESVDLFSRAEALVHSPVHLLFLARAYAKLGQLVKAQEAYIKIRRESVDSDAPTAFRRAATAADTEIQQIEPRLAHLTIKLESPEGVNVSVTMDDNPVSPVLLGVSSPVDPGSHSIRAMADGAEPVEASVTLAEGESNSVSLRIDVPETAPEPLDPAQPAPVTDAAPEGDSGAGDSGSWMTPLGWSGVGVGVVGLGLGGYFLWDYLDLTSQSDQLFNDNNCGVPNVGCPAVRPQIDELDSQRTESKTLATVSFAVGGALVAGGVTLLIIDSMDDSAAASRVRPWIGWKSAGISGTF